MGNGCLIPQRGKRFPIRSADGTACWWFPS